MIAEWSLERRGFTFSQGRAASFIPSPIGDMVAMQPAWAKIRRRRPDDTALSDHGQTLTPLPAVTALPTGRLVLQKYYLFYVRQNPHG